MKHLIVVVGPTAVGKTAMAIELARHFGTEVVSADSRQFYREMQLGTAKPSPQEMAEAPHHFINSRSIHDDYDVGAYEKDALKLLDELFQKHDIVVLTGGSGLFVDAVCSGFDALPKAAPGVREDLIIILENEGITALQKELEEVDPEYYSQVDKMNPQRLMRALEVWRSTGKKFSEFRKGNKVKQRSFGIIKIGLDMERETLYKRIDLRMDQMIASGLFDEARKLLPYRHLNALQTVGYREIFGFLQGDYDHNEAVRLLKRNSRRYAKRQLTWFRKDDETQWFLPSQKEAILVYVENKLRKV